MALFSGFRNFGQGQRAVGRAAASVRGAGERWAGGSPAAACGANHYALHDEAERVGGLWELGVAIGSSPPECTVERAVLGPGNEGLPPKAKCAVPQ
jgi:hypothetical protein